MGRPPLSQTGKVAPDLHVYLPPPLNCVVRAHAEKLGIARSELIRRALYAYFQDEFARAKEVT
jgi:hypothetical protein